MNHDWALGASPIVVWGLMIFDSLLVGLMAGLTGTALYLGYAGFARSAEESATGLQKPGIEP
jgi:ABC-type antimicrobial peptide transport system permease subunit